MSIHICSENEIEKIILKTNQFIREHSLNYNRAIKKIICKKNVDLNEYKNLNNCSFEKYINFLSKLDSTINHIELVKIHKNFHKFINQTLSDYSKGEAISEKLFNDLYSNHIKLLDLLNEIVFRFDFTRNQLDKLTGTWNREIFIEFLEKEYLEVKRGKKVFSLVYFDIDFFKFINDTYSHASGDYILKELIELIKNNLRMYDSISRWGGDEFLILLPNTFLEEALFIIDRIKNKINKKIFIFNSLEIKITCSFGIAEATKNETISEIINNADKLLYKSKNLGRNRIEI